MIHIGLTGWGDHPSLYNEKTAANKKLVDYSRHFPIVELDSTFYAIQSEKMMKKWTEETPADFQFIVKAYQGITGHQRGKLPYESEEEMFSLFKLSMTSFAEAGKLAMVLVQFPPWFDCQKENVDRIRYVHEQLQPLPIAVEFRHQSWYTPAYRQKTLDFLQSLNIIHVVCDEPQVGDGSVPLVPVATDSKVLLRLHGRNDSGWVNTQRDSKAWRKVRYLYDYSEKELQGMSEIVSSLEQQAEEVFVIFNNNSGQHAAKNAKQFAELFNIECGQPLTKQMDLFEEDL
ncbi:MULTISPECIES: DUF72 domain-containing protein [unclassified Sporosarcina]|uniref:DUF72 domain-containing protein n=1 Tax=unclassified Sporosarcina TaxID=2647733 RepID=UPI00203BE5D6|nr:MULTISPECIES: DUF72 domain-containing protein [unclassified Sporosarcina]GKV66630.1 UPF0759 protein YunF [Sporosarcina sp. NCCP-2331]GLB56966.1 UPF0759 protein YunF [Sporosarcina sp. NCCP-2378]